MGLGLYVDVVLLVTVDRTHFGKMFIQHLMVLLTTQKRRPASTPRKDEIKLGLDGS